MTRITRDKVYGAFAPVRSPITTRLPSGLKRSLEVVRDSVDANNTTVLHSSLRINGDRFTSVYNRTTRRLTLASPLNRSTTIDLDLVGRPVTVSPGGFAAVSLVYDAGTGFLRDLAQGPATGTTTTMIPAA